MDVDQEPPATTSHTKTLLLLLAEFKENIALVIQHATREQPNLTALHCKRVLTGFSKFNPALRQILINTEPFNKLDSHTLDTLYNSVCSVFSVHYAALTVPSPIDHPKAGKLKYTHLLMLIVALCDHVRTVHASAERRTRLNCCCAGDFPFVRRKFLAYEATQPIATYSLSLVMNALYAVYAAIPNLQYNRELENYTHMLMWRARQFLVVSQSSDANDVSQLRVDEGNGVFSWSTQLLYDLTILEKSLLGWFDAANLVERVDAPSTAHITPQLVQSFRSFLRQSASLYGDSDLKVDVVACYARPGELEFFENASPGDDPNVYAAIQMFRPGTYTAMMERAQLPLQKLLGDELSPDPAKQKQTFMLSLTVLYVFMKQLNKHVTAINVEHVIIRPGLFDTRKLHVLHEARAKNLPLIVWCCNTLQLWHNNKLYMYNDPIVTCVSWMQVVSMELNNKFNHITIVPLLDAAFYAFESSDDKVKRKTADARRRIAGTILQ